MKTQEISALLKQTKEVAYDKFKELSSMGEIDFTQGEDLEEIVEDSREYELPTIELKNSFTGDVYDVHVVSIGKDGQLYILITGDGADDAHLQPVTDINSVEGLIYLINEMEATL